MDFAFTEEQEMFRQSVRDFAKREITKDLLDAMEREQVTHSPEIWKKMADLGWLALCWPEEYGGLGGDAVYTAILNEELSRAGADMGSGPPVGVYSGTVGFGAQSIMAYGSEEQKKFFLPRIARGELLLCFGLTEPDAGSDAVSLNTSATPSGGDYVISGNKIFTSHAHVADYMLIAARTDKSVAKHKGITVFIVPANAQGVSVRPLWTLGGDRVNEVYLDEVRVPRENILGELNRGWYHLMQSLNLERASLPAGFVGVAERILDLATEYAKERVQFGQPIGKFQAIQHMLAEIATEISAGRLLAYQAAWKQSKGLPFDIEASMAKLYCSELCKRASLVGMQVLGGYGFMMEYEMQRLYRRVVVFTVGGGSSQIQKSLIAARHLGL